MSAGSWAQSHQHPQDEPMSSPADDPRLWFPATQRNVKPLGDVLAEELPPTGLVLEIASGSGEHAVAFQRRFPSLQWQASDPDPVHRASIDGWSKTSGLDNRMPAALNLDVRAQPWSIPAAPSAIVCVNLLHISPRDCSESLVQGASRLLAPGRPLLIYGPFRRDGAHTSQSNAQFDASLKAQNPQWGIRDLEWIEELGAQHQIPLQASRLMPANNLTLVMRKA